MALLVLATFGELIKTLMAVAPLYLITWNNKKRGVTT
jgi:hypothetical protein